MDDFTQLDTLRALLDRARGHLSTDDLPGLIMSDPGSGAYVAAYQRVLTGGVPALLSADEHGPLLHSFDITENLLLSHADAGRSSIHRWFSVLTASIELLGWNGFEGPRWTTPFGSIRHLLVDSYALHDTGARDAPLDLLPTLCRELRGATQQRHQHVALLLAELLVGAHGSTDVEQSCRELTRYHEQSQIWCDENGDPNPWFSSNPTFVWGVMNLGRRELRTWLELVENHFPREPALANGTRQRLLAAGKSTVEDAARRARRQIDSWAGACATCAGGPARRRRRQRR